VQKHPKKFGGLGKKPHSDSIFDKTQMQIWTSDLVRSKLGAWIVNFEQGLCYDTSIEITKHVRAVRSEQ
jgi:hypothetical protein